MDLRYLRKKITKHSSQHNFMSASPQFVNFTLTDLHQIIDIDMGVIINFDEMHRRFGGNFVNYFACLLGSLSFIVLHTFVCQDIHACFLFWRTLWHDVEVAFSVVIQMVVKVQDSIFLV